MDIIKQIHITIIITELDTVIIATVIPQNIIEAKAISIMETHGQTPQGHPAADLLTMTTAALLKVARQDPHHLAALIRVLLPDRLPAPLEDRLVDLHLHPTVQADINMSYSGKQLEKVKDNLDNRIEISNSVQGNSSLTVITDNQKVIMKALRLLLNTLAEPFDPGPNG
jgi:hypothetical protein